MREFILLLLLPFAARGADFIESVHAQGADIAKEMVVEGSQVVWSPFSVVNVLPLINGDESLKLGFKSSIDHLKDAEGVQVARLNVAYIKDKTKVKSIAEEYGVEVLDFPSEGELKDVLTEKYRDEFGVDAPPGLLPDSLENTTQLYLTSLLVRAEWEQPFKYAPKGRFYLNETHAVKARYMSNIGFYKYGEIKGVDGKILAIPLKNSSTTYFMVVVPNNSSGLSLVSQQFAEVQVSNITDKLKKKRTQLTLPKITVDSQLLLEPMPGIKIIQSGSLRFTYTGLDNRASKLRRSSTKFLRNRSNKQDLKFFVNKPFIYLIYDTKAGVLNYGEVLLPTDQSNIKINYKSDSEKITKLSQNAKSLSEANNEFGNNLYQNLRSKLGSFGISPIGLANLLASYSTVANSDTQQLFFSTLNSKSGMIELNNNIYYLNSTSKNLTRITVAKEAEALIEKVYDLGTEVLAGDEEKKTFGYYEYSYKVNLLFLKKYVRSFYKNERDSSNVTFYEYQGRVKYISLPFWDARAILLFASPTQSLLIFIPNERSGLHLVEDGLKDFVVSKLLCQMRDRFVRIRLPFFKLESQVDLLPSLKEVLEVGQISFDGLGDSVLESLVQKVNVNISGERETIKLRSKYQTRKRPSTRINVDRPFVFYVLDNTVGTLVTGRVVDVPSLVSSSCKTCTEVDPLPVAPPAPVEEKVAEIVTTTETANLTITDAPITAA